MTAPLIPGWDSPEPVIKQAEESGIRSKILKLLLLNSSVRVAHWRASTKTNEHGALGDLYAVVDGFMDAFIEMEMGRAGGRDFSSVSGEVNASASNADLIKDLRTAAVGLLEEARSKNAEDLINAAAELIGAVNKAAYLLEV
jgi:hypothetical protein